MGPPPADRLICGPSLHDARGRRGGVVGHGGEQATKPRRRSSGGVPARQVKAAALGRRQPHVPIRPACVSMRRPPSCRLAGHPMALPDLEVRREQYRHGNQLNCGGMPPFWGFGAQSGSKPTLSERCATPSRAQHPTGGGQVGAAVLGPDVVDADLAGSFPPRGTYEVDGAPDRRSARGATDQHVPARGASS